jgi:hypothetical protein
MKAKQFVSKPETKVLKIVTIHLRKNPMHMMILGLLKEVSKPCCRKGETKKMARCLGSKDKPCQIISRKLEVTN